MRSMAEEYIISIALCIDRFLTCLAALPVSNNTLFWFSLVCPLAPFLQPTLSPPSSLISLHSIFHLPLT